ncbi:MAG: NUDIX domain-containing protein [Chloroflexota bacterium]
MSKKTIKARVFSGGFREFPVSRIEYFRPSTYGIVVHEGKMLLLHNKNSTRLSLPGGGIDLGESNAEALKREFLEETGMHVEVGKLAGQVQDFFYYDPKDILVHTFLFFYSCKPLTFDLLSDDQIQDEESIKPRWFNPEELQADQLVSNGREILNFATTGRWE